MRKRRRGFVFSAFTRVTFRATFCATDLLFLATAFFTTALRVEELPLPIAEDARFATARFAVVLADFELLLAPCRATRFVAGLLLGVAFFAATFLTATFLASFFAGAFTAPSVIGDVVAGATATGPAAGAVVCATVLNSCDGVVDAAFAPSTEIALMDPNAMAAIVNPTAVLRMRRDVPTSVRCVRDRTGIHLYFL